MNTELIKLAALRAGRASVCERFNPDMLVTAREAARMTQQELADSIGVSQPLVGHWETRLSQPDGEQINVIARALRVRPEFFFVDRSRRLASMSDFYHRAFAKAKRTDVKATHARCSIIDLQVDRLLDLCPPLPDRIRLINPDNHAGDVEQVAAMSRVAMGVGEGPIPNLVTMIEESGGIVIDYALEVDEIDALCRWVPGLPKLFFVNGAKPADRTRFSLAHELGHTVMHFDNDVDPKLAEDQANAFASAFLMPARDIRRDFRPMMGLEDFAALKRKWRVSMQALIRRAHHLGALDDLKYTALFTQLSRKGWRKTEPVPLSGESPQTMTHMLRAHLNNGYTIESLSAMLFVDEQAVRAMVSDAQSPTWEQNGVRMRLVR